MATIADDITAAQAADAALAAAQAAIAPAQQADQAADALVVADLTAAGVPVLVGPQADGVSYSVYTLAPGSPGYTVTTAKLASGLTSSSTTPTPTPTPAPVATS